MTDSAGGEQGGGQRVTPGDRPDPRGLFVCAARPGPGHTGWAVLRCDAASACPFSPEKAPLAAHPETTVSLLWPLSSLDLPAEGSRRCARRPGQHGLCRVLSIGSSLISTVCFVISAFLTSARNTLRVPKEVSSLPGGVYQS